jgi:hypothetical protein
MNKRGVVIVLLGVGTTLAAGTAMAGKVNMPKRGSYDFVFCVVDQAKSLAGGERHFVSHYQGVAMIRTDPPGRAFDRTSGVCYGTFMNLAGRVRGFGMCELIDMDGDKFWMEYTDSTDGSSGTYTSPWGTGKYDGMTMKGEYKVESWPTSRDAAFQVCNPNKGTYELK